jgi:hypothetical protein
VPVDVSTRFRHPVERYHEEKVEKEISSYVVNDFRDIRTKKEAKQFK